MEFKIFEIIAKDDKIELSVYRRNTMLTTPWSSNIPNRHKRNAIKACQRRSKRISANFNDKDLELKKFSAADYPQWEWFRSFINEKQSVDDGHIIIPRHSGIARPVINVGVFCQKWVFSIFDKSNIWQSLMISWNANLIYRLNGYQGKRNCHQGKLKLYTEGLVTTSQQNIPRKHTLEKQWELWKPDNKYKKPSERLNLWVHLNNKYSTTSIWQVYTMLQMRNSWIKF